jgi:hypothetical protein
MSIHVFEVLGVMDVPSFIIGRVQPSENIWTEIRRGVAMTVPKPNSVYDVDIEVVTRLPKDLLDIFAVLDTQSEDLTSCSLWNWQGRVTTPLNTHLWDCWRYAGILGARRRARQRTTVSLPPTLLHQTEKAKGPDSSIQVPKNDVVLSRLISSFDATRRIITSAHSNEEQSHLFRALLYPFMMASLEISLLKANPDARQILANSRADLRVQVPRATTAVALELLDEAWNSGNDSFNIDEAAKRRGQEVALF